MTQTEEEAGTGCRVVRCHLHQTQARMHPVGRGNTQAYLRRRRDVELHYAGEAAFLNKADLSGTKEKRSSDTDLRDTWRVYFLVLVSETLPGHGNTTTADVSRRSPVRPVRSTDSFPGNWSRSASFLSQTGNLCRVPGKRYGLVTKRRA